MCTSLSRAQRHPNDQKTEETRMGYSPALLEGRLSLSIVFFPLDTTGGFHQEKTPFSCCFLAN